MSMFTKLYIISIQVFPVWGVHVRLKKLGDFYFAFAVI